MSLKFSILVAVGATAMSFPRSVPAKEPEATQSVLYLVSADRNVRAWIDGLCSEIRADREQWRAYTAVYVVDDDDTRALRDKIGELASVPAPHAAAEDLVVLLHEMKREPRVCVEAAPLMGRRTFALLMLEGDKPTEDLTITRDSWGVNGVARQEPLHIFGAERSSDAVKSFARCVGHVYLGAWPSESPIVDCGQGWKRPVRWRLVASAALLLVTGSGASEAPATNAQAIFQIHRVLSSFSGAQNLLCALSGRRTARAPGRRPGGR